MTAEHPPESGDEHRDGPDKIPDADPTGSMTAPWIGQAQDSDVVISSRVRLARNVAGFNFVTRMDAADRRSVLALIRAGVGAGAASHKAGEGLEPTGVRVWIDIEKLDRHQRSLLVERHLISTDHARGTAGGETQPDRGSESARALLLSVPDQRLAVMLNEEDHIRIQAILPGLSLGEAAELAARADDEIERTVDYAFSARFGYLTACPTNVGTGARYSVMLHLPALRLLGEIDKVRRAANDMALAVRGFWGEGSDSHGDFYQLSNQTTLGVAEDTLLDRLEHAIVPKIIAYERRARDRLLSSRRTMLEDTVYRAVGVLTHARRLSTSESLQRLSEVRLGVAAGVLSGPTLEEISTLLLASQPEHVKRAVPGTTSETLRASRAAMVRKWAAAWSIA
ncbi:MAG: ATP--guanido phosphotransferase [Planctomycetota bacterium]